MMEARQRPDAFPAGNPTRLGRVVLINDIAEMKGGATGIALLAARVLRERGIRTTYFTGLNPLNPVQAETVSTGSRHILEGTRASAMLRGLNNTRARLKLAQWISENDTPETIYHVHGWSKVLSPSIFTALRPVSHRLIIHAHDFFLSCPNGGYFNYRKGELCALKPLRTACLGEHCDRRHYTHKLWRSVRLLALRHAIDLSTVGRILVVHDEMIPLFRRQGVTGPNVRVLRNPIEPWTTTRIPAENNNQFIYVGRLSDEKGCLLVAQAARAANVPLRFIGDGPLARQLRESYPEFEILGWRDRSEISQLCRHARALVLPSQSRETFGIAALEAVMSGLPVLVTKYALLADELIDADLGSSFDPLDPIGFASALRLMADDDEMVARMSRAGVADGRSLAPTVDTWAENLIAHYHSVLACTAVSHERANAWSASRSANAVPLSPAD